LVNLINVVCNYLFIFGVGFLPKMGVAGAALSAITARFVGVSLGIWALYSGKFKVALVKGTSYKPDWGIMKRILNIGVPSGIQGIFRNSSSVAFTKIIAMTASATSGVAALSIGFQIERLTRTMSLAFAVVATTLVGQSLGAGNQEEAEKRGWTTGGLIVAITGALSLMFVLFPREIIRIFSGSEEVTSLGVSYLIAAAVAEPFTALSIVMAGGLRGAGETKYPLYYTIIAQWLIRLPLAYIIAFPLGFGAKGAWWALAISSVIQGLLTANKFREGDWKKREVI
jgi:putative MATE family efflux protein